MKRVINIFILFFLIHFIFCIKVYAQCSLDYHYTSKEIPLTKRDSMISKIMPQSRLDSIKIFFYMIDDSVKIHFNDTLITRAYLKYYQHNYISYRIMVPKQPINEKKYVTIELKNGCQFNLELLREYNTILLIGPPSENKIMINYKRGFVVSDANSGWEY